MDKPVRAPRYDLFKLIVAILLLLIFLLLLWRGNSQPLPLTPIPTDTALSTSTTVPAITASQVSSTVFPQASTTPTLLPVSTSTVNSQPSLTSTPMPSATDTPASQPTSNATSVPSTTDTPTSEPTPTEQGPVSSNACDDAMSRSRLKVGLTGTILRKLNFRSSPGIQNNWLLTHRPGTKIEIVGGPVCLPYYKGAYIWWQIKLPDGRVGWSAEASLFGKFYFMEPGQ